MKTGTHARHSKDNNGWMTPTYVVEPSREVLGGIDLDPASDAAANEVVRAWRYFTEQDNGLTNVWRVEKAPTRVFLNAPGDLVNEFWAKLMDEYAAGSVIAAVWVGFSVEQLQSMQQKRHIALPQHFPICYPRARIPFLETDAMREARRLRCLERGLKFNPRSAPSHANYLTYVGPYPKAFVRVFERLGSVVIPREVPNVREQLPLTTPVPQESRPLRLTFADDVPERQIPAEGNYLSGVGIQTARTGFDGC